MVFRKQANPEGKYKVKDIETIDEEGNKIVIKDDTRYDIISCERTESMEQVQVGTTTETDEEGNEIEVPVYESRVVINKGWDSFDSLEQAMEAYGVEEYLEPVTNKKWRNIRKHRRGKITYGRNKD